MLGIGATSLAVLMPWVKLHHNFVYGPNGGDTGAVTVDCYIYHAQTTLPNFSRDGLFSCSDTIYAINTDSNAVYMTVADNIEEHARNVSLYLLLLSVTCGIGQLAGLTVSILGQHWSRLVSVLRVVSRLFFAIAAAGGVVVLHSALHARRGALAPPDANSPTAATTVEFGLGLIWLLAAPLLGILSN